jgi:serine phosphatase RsbU (regulator of sigma subunit)
VERTKHIARDIAWAIAALTLAWIVLKFAVGAHELSLLPQYGCAHTKVANAVIEDEAVHIQITGPSGTKDISRIAKAASDSILVFTTVSEQDFPKGERPLKRDTLVTLNEKAATSDLWGTEIEGLHPIGHTVPITYRHAGEIHSATLVMARFPSDWIAMMWGFLILSSFVGLLYYGIAVFTLYRQGGAVQARVLALLTLTLCMVVSSILPAMSRSMTGQSAASRVWGSDFLDYLGLLATFGTAYWLHLAFSFPFQSPTLKKRPWLALALCYAPPVMALSDRLFSIGGSSDGVLSGLSGFASFAMFVQFIAGFWILWRKRKRAQNTIEKRQLKAVFLGAMLGPAIFIVPLLIIVVLAILFEGNIHIPDTLAIAGLLFLLCLAFLPIPISLLYAFRKYRLMEVELRLRRGTRFAFTTGGLLIVFFALLYGITTLLLRTFALESGTAALAAGLVLALSFAPVQRRTQRLIEQKFFPERKRLRAMLDAVLASASTMPDHAALWISLESGLKQGLGVAAVIPALYDERTNTFRRPEGETVQVDVDGDLAARLLERARPLFVDEMLATKNITLSDAEARYLTEHNATVLLPMVIHRRLTGFLILAFAPEQEDIAAEDLNVLSSVVSQVALQSENLRLLEENIEKRRLQEQLEMAREVQQRFLPQVLPDTPGLHVAARFHSSLEVAGDYYDVVPLTDGRTLLAVGDVAGKGAGAAMIMANVQASLRSMARAGVSLATIVSGVNDLLCVNTDAAQFVTFFAAIYSPADHSFTCINAGHNPPRVLRSDGTVIPLETGGICLGVLPGAVYQEETIGLATGDILIAFTDGVCEAMNAHDEEFGEDHIADVCLMQRTLEPDVLADTVEHTVTLYHGSGYFEDDFTLLIVKVV